MQDTGLISHIFTTSWRKAYRGLIAQDYLDRLPDEYWVPSVRAWLMDGRFSALLVYRENQPVGCCIFGRGRDEDYGDWGEIVSLYMLPYAARQGLGGALLDAALDDMRQEGYSRFYLWAIRGNVSADAFYQSHGFRPTGDTTNFHIGGTPVTDLRYVREDT